MRNQDRRHDQRDADEEETRLEMEKDEYRASEEHQVGEEREKGIRRDALHFGDVVVEAGERVSHGNFCVEAG